MKILKIFRKSRLKIKNRPENSNGQNYRKMSPKMFKLTTKMKILRKYSFKNV